jgi:O-acetyl-ADP-ribose deacetylase (regulator of RNase III)
MIEYVMGNILNTGADILVNPVNCVGVMGRGLAKKVKEGWPGCFFDYERACREGRVRLGEMNVFHLGIYSIPRFIVNFPTKKHWRNPSHLPNIASGLDDLRTTVLNLPYIETIAVPCLGCGLGGLDWKDVKPLIEAFAESLPDVKVLVYLD